MKIDQAASIGLCKKACNFGKDGKCGYHGHPSHNYRNIEPGECALTQDEVATMRREYALGGKR